ncbi:MAG TPA: cobalamin-binding protein [Chloroflexota bacterium]|nr:cobalamin-binding protein [Chloroflexota bacterium]
MTDAPRICSLLPSATEIVFALGLGDRLVGVTHECDYPAEARAKPHVTSSIIDSPSLSQSEIDAAVRESLAENATIYHLDRDLLEQLQPDLVLTQDLCAVCAVGSNEVEDVVGSLSSRPEVVSLEPTTLGEVFDTILRVGRLAGRMREAIALVDRLRDRVARVREVVAGRPPVPVLTLEWLDPPFVGGHWVPEMVALAGGRDVLGTAGRPSRQVAWDEVAGTNPEIAVLMPCGFDLERTIRESEDVTLPDVWRSLASVREGNVFAVDGSAYFNRPGPRLVDGVEILAAILHPDEFGPLRSDGFVRLGTTLASR